MTTRLDAALALCRSSLLPLFQDLAEEVPAVVSMTAVSERRNDVSVAMHSERLIFLGFDDAFPAEVRSGLYLDSKGRLVRTQTWVSRRFASRIDTTICDLVGDEALGLVDLPLLMSRLRALSSREPELSSRPKMATPAIRARA
ncbi:hypothetical protein OWM54_43085 [Myxococcus sp. MISCRS1]|uniref:hypothetical protein n=1 Tax=Myxococcus sp. MISCRS1 TaxID=2996786 RepID=UPI0022721081|nr:hypothetical protein [Myxococcus sp. MISCRS1]MCY1003951.1 hypothetical protein [Myxococcus sp. MISCRS1]